ERNELVLLEPAREPKLPNAVLVQDPRQAVARLLRLVQHRASAPAQVCIGDLERELLGLLPHARERNARDLERPQIAGIVVEVKLMRTHGFHEGAQQLFDQQRRERRLRPLLLFERGVRRGYRHVAKIPSSLTCDTSLSPRPLTHKSTE